MLSSRSVWGLVMAKIRTWSTSTVIGRQSRKIGVIEDSPGQFHREQVSSAIHRGWQRVFPCYLKGGEKDFPIKREQYLKGFTTLERCIINQIWKILQTVFLAFLIIQHFSIYFIIIVFFINEYVCICVCVLSSRLWDTCGKSHVEPSFTMSLICLLISIPLTPPLPKPLLGCPWTFAIAT